MQKTHKIKIYFKFYPAIDAFSADIACPISFCDIGHLFLAHDVTSREDFLAEKTSKQLENATKT